MRNGILFFFLVFGLNAEAFIPRAEYVLKKAAEQSGKAVYQVEKQTHFKDPVNRLSLRESWVVQSDRAMKVTVRTGHQVVYQALFLDGKKYVRGEEPINVGVDFFEQHFHQRSSKAWLGQLIRMKVLSPAAAEAPVIKDIKTYQYQGDGEVRLARTQGLIAFQLGKPSIPEAPKSNRFWFDQDSFQLVRLGLESGAEIRTRGSKNSGKGLIHPAEFTVNAGETSVDIETQSIEVLKNSGNNLDPKLLSAPRWDLLPSAELRAQIESFYKRFR